MKRDEKIKSHLYIAKVVSIRIVNNYNCLGLEQDIYQDACEGVIIAVDKYNGRKKIESWIYDKCYWYTIQCLRDRRYTYFSHRASPLKKVPMPEVAVDDQFFEFEFNRLISFLSKYGKGGIILARILMGEKQSVIAAEMKLTKSRISQIVKEVKSRIREEIIDVV